jgi:hypothetical protein
MMSQYTMAGVHDEAKPLTSGQGANRARKGQGPTIPSRTCSQKPKELPLAWSHKVYSIFIIILCVKI